MTITTKSLDHCIVVLAVLIAGVVAGCTGPEPPILTVENHLNDEESGWKRSDCFTCHTRDECVGTGPDSREPDCVGCHGFNGARDYYHLPDQDCYRAGCHASSHPGQGFIAPLDCKACHYHGGY
jgi:hypothetical protein